MKLLENCEKLSNSKRFACFYLYSNIKKANIQTQEQNSNYRELRHGRKQENLAIKKQTGILVVMKIFYITESVFPSPLNYTTVWLPPGKTK